jgi:stalled ribosome rescue protein Dom34
MGWVEAETLAQRGYQRGYAVAILVGLQEDRTVLWKVFSHVVKPEATVMLDGTRSDTKALYNFHEKIVNALRPAVKEGVGSVMVASPARCNYGEKLLQHIRDHHAWLTQGTSKTAFSQMTGTATTKAEVTVLTRDPAFRRITEETTAEETENLLDLLEKRMNTQDGVGVVLYSLEEVENAVLCTWTPGKPKPDYMLVTDSFASTPRIRGRIQRLIQIASNKGVKTRIVKAESPTGKRLLQLGGIVCLTRR